MIVAFEGLDGSGKTTTTPLVVARLCQWGYAASATTKRCSVVRDTFARQQIEALSDRLWGIPHDARLDSVGALHWIYLNAAFFAATHHALTREAAEHGLVIMDNWINKFAARIARSGEISLADVLRILQPLPRPDLVFMLDVEPSTAVSRKASASDAERGLLANATSFEAYQIALRGTLLSMASQFGWIVIAADGRTPDDIADDVAARIRQHLSGRCQVLEEDGG